MEVFVAGGTRATVEVYSIFYTNLRKNAQVLSKII
jgi:hypothetical protein